MSKINTAKLQKLESLAPPSWSSIKICRFRVVLEFRSQKNPLVTGSASLDPSKTRITEYGITSVCGITSYVGEVT